MRDSLDAPEISRRPRSPGSSYGPVDWREQHTLESADHNEAERARRRHQRETITIPRLRVLGAAGLVFAVLLHNAALLHDLQLHAVIPYAALWGVYLVVSKWALSRYYRVDARVDLGGLFLGIDIALFVLSIYVSGGERSWMFAVVSVRVADQIGTSQRRAFSFATIGMALHALLVLYMAFVEARPFSLTAELSKVALVYLLNLYLAMAAGPGEAQRRRANHMADVARALIEELRHKTEQLEHERERALAASAAKGAFLSNMSHEIRTPMTAVLGMAELLLSEDLSPGQREMAETILGSGRALLALVNDVLDMSKVEAGQLNLAREDMDISKVIHGALSPMRVLASGKGLALRFEAEGLPDRPVRGDALRIKQVLLNLIGNAIKFTEKGSVTVSARTKSQDEHSCRIELSVRDTGIGMTEAQLSHAFEPFQQADVSTTRQFGGTGLGLSIAKRLVGLMGGELAAVSEPTRGSTFRFELEFTMAEVRTKPDRQGDPLAVDLLRARAPRILVAEDTEINRALFARMLGHLGCRVDCVENGALAVERLTGKHTYDAVLMDWHMPVMDGLEAVTRIRRHEQERGGPRLPIICVTASAFADEVARCRDAGMDEVLSKPLVWAELERALCRCTLDNTTRVRVSDRPVRSTNPGSRLNEALLEELAGLDPEPHALLSGLFEDLFVGATAVLVEVEAAIERRDYATVKARAHALKGSASGIGASLLSARFAELEHHAHPDDRDITDAFERAREELERTRTAATHLLERFQHSDRPSDRASA